MEHLFNGCLADGLLFCWLVGWMFFRVFSMFNFTDFINILQTFSKHHRNLKAGQHRHRHTDTHTHTPTPPHTPTHPPPTHPPPLPLSQKLRWPLYVWLMKGGFLQIQFFFFFFLKNRSITRILQNLKTHTNPKAGAHFCGRFL